MTKAPQGPGAGRFCIVLAALTLLVGCGGAGPRVSNAGRVAEAPKEYSREDALRMIRSSEGRLAPVYGPLAEQLVDDLDLDGRTGIGIDLGSGPGTLVIELCKRTEMHWINADINPHFFPFFLQRAEEHGCGGRVSAIQADAQALPFRDDYADVIVSRGSFWLWGDKVAAFGEIRRVLKPGGVAYIGRGLSANLPLEVAQAVRGGRGEGPQYDVAATAQELHAIMKSLRIKDYRVIRPRLDNEAGVNYGVWVEFRKSRGG
ncbi:MAG: class I SAM-dependent methyltransferase [Sedimentisphaerales bacterium]|nr:class I SAM-dependent methyltransferase [Sedimentisphaerales bacterium]HNY78943.1 class I SAM-dependent methyltransferase [Sedimentisphaerales bacterium]HOC62641.1 class I SAM-dependent methyltransferase [Sedimentisphaerales bacterium]HOH64839.1 class I SAM-dependent methyltransferase [Sedimentisphaerales bacterium]HPY50594.1 class I SAM-dependent methyltransferase [Sedimentisphaerales bacterium]